MVGSKVPPRRVLVLADQPVMIELISLTLDHGAFVTRSAPNVDEANAVIREWRPDVAVIDMDLGAPGFLGELKPHAAGDPAIPILALTRRGDLKHKLEAFDQGVDDVVTVPFSPEELLARVVVITSGPMAQARASSRRSGWATSRSTSSTGRCAREDRSCT